MTKQEFGEKYITRADVNKLIADGTASDDLIKTATTMVSAHPILEEILSGNTEEPTEPAEPEPTEPTPDAGGDEGLPGNIEGKEEV